MTRARVQETFLCFENHCVKIRLESAEVFAHLEKFAGRMLSPDRIGETCGSLHIVADRQGIGLWLKGGTDGPKHFLRAGMATRVLLHEGMKALIRARQDLLWLHAGAAGYGGRAVLLCAHSANGKSSTVSELLERGWSYLSDEVAPLDATDGSVHPFPLNPHKRVNDGATLERDDALRLSKVAVGLDNNRIAAHPVRIAHIYFLSWAPESMQPVAQPCSPGVAVLELLANSLSLDESRRGELQAMCALMARLPATHLRFADPRDAAQLIREQMGVAFRDSPHPLPLEYSVVSAD
jgi:hypothetical protein